MMATTLEIADEIAEATVTVAEKLSKFDSSGAVLQVAQYIAVEAYRTAHPAFNFGNLTATGASLLQKEN